MIKSPGGPPFEPGSPWPDMDIAWPWSIPAGTFTLIVTFFLTLPLPEQTVQGSVTVLPVPPHLSQVRTFTNEPKGVACLTLTCPEPPQLVQLLVDLDFEPVPSQVLQLTYLLTETSFSVPKAASSKVMVMVVLMSAPFTGPLDCLEPNPVPKKSKMSSSPPKPNPPKSKPPKPPPAALLGSKAA